jgi:hypothetical protein
VYLHLHGLIFETSVSLLAGSTRYRHLFSFLFLPYSFFSLERALLGEPKRSRRRARSEANTKNRSTSRSLSRRRTPLFAPAPRWLPARRLATDGYLLHRSKPASLRPFSRPVSGPSLSISSLARRVLSAWHAAIGTDLFVFIVRLTVTLDVPCGTRL